LTVHWSLGIQIIRILRLRPCKKRNFLNFSFSRVSELFCFRSLKILRKKFGNKFGSKHGFWGQKQGFLNIPNLRNIRNLFYSKFSENYEKAMSKLNFYFHKKLIPTQIFEIEFGMQGPNWDIPLVIRYPNKFYPN